MTKFLLFNNSYIRINSIDSLTANKGIDVGEYMIIIHANNVNYNFLYKNEDDADREFYRIKSELGIK